MKCYIENIMTDTQVSTDLKILIPEASMRRRMSRVLKTGVSTAVECLGGRENIDRIDAVVTATGLGCLADSEKFLRNVIDGNEQLLNPTPFIQSTFNTVGGQVALLRHNHCYNVTYVNRGHSFEDALLDTMMRIDDGESRDVLLGAFDERTESQFRIMQRMGCYRQADAGEGAVFAELTAEATSRSFAAVTRVDFPGEALSEEECRQRYADASRSEVLVCRGDDYGVYPTVSARYFAEAAEMIRRGDAEQVIVYNPVFHDTPAVTVLEWLG